MFVMERRVAQLFRLALRRCFDGPAARADQIPILLRSDPNGWRMQAVHPDFAILYSQPGPTGEGSLAFPAVCFGPFEGRTADPVELEVNPSGKGTARWSDRGIDRQMVLPTVSPESVPMPPERPHAFAPMPRSFLTALHEAGRATAKEPTKYVLHRLLLKGKAGQIVATDSKQLLLQGGFSFPFEDDVIIPRSAAFGLPPFQEIEEVAIGRTDTHVFLRVGRWIFAFTIDAKGRFPDIAGLIPRPFAAGTRFHLDPRDADYFVRVLGKRLIKPTEQEIFLTLDLSESPCFRIKLDEAITEIALPRSQVTGPGLRLNLNLKHLLRAIEMQFQEFEIRDAEKPFVARDGNRVLLAMPCSAQGVLPPVKDAVRFTPSLEEGTRPSRTRSIARAPVKSPSRPLVAVESVALSGSTALVASTDPFPGRDRAFDLFAEAEGFTQAVVQAAVHAGRL